MKKLLPVLISLSITPTVFAQYVYECENCDTSGQDRRWTIFFGVVAIISVGAFIKLNYEHYVHKTGEGEGSWMLLLIALASLYAGYWI